MYNDFFGGFDFNCNGHIDGYERTTAIDYIESTYNGYSGAGSGCYSSGVRHRGQISSLSTGEKSFSNPAGRSCKRLMPEMKTFCNIYGGYYANKKDKL